LPWSVKPGRVSLKRDRCQWKEAKEFWNMFLELWYIKYLRIIFSPLERSVRRELP